jgi:hypothetical protein
MPVDMPAYAFTALSLAPDLGIGFARSQGGLLITSRSSDPYWKGTMTTGALEVSPINHHADFMAFLCRCVDLNMRVDFVHPRHRVPQAYTFSNWPMAGNASLVGVTNLRTIVVSDLTPGIVLKRGDRISLGQGNLLCHRWIAADVTVSSAISQTLELTPRLPMGVFASGASIVLKDPKMRVMIIPGSWQAAEAGGPTPISFDVSESF